MRRLLAATAAAAAVLTAPLAADASHFDRPCGGVLDVNCFGVTCSMDCFGYECLVWVDARHDPHSAVCVSTLPHQ